MKEKIRQGMAFYKLDNRWFTSYINETNESTLTILLLLNVHSNRNGFTTISINYLMSMFGVGNNSRKSIKKFKASLQFLLETGQISVHKNFLDPEKVDIDFNKVNIDETIYIKITSLEKRYTVVYYNEVESILRYEKLDIRYRRTLLRFFCTLVHRINNDTNYCYPSIRTLTKESGVRSEVTCLKYLSILRDELGIIIYDSANLSFSKNGIEYQTPNLYARPEHHKDLLKGVHGQFSVFEKQNSKLLRAIDKEDQNKKRSLKQKMNFLDKERTLRELTPEEEQYYLELQSEYAAMEYKRKKKEKKEEELLTGRLEDEPYDNQYRPYEEEDDYLTEDSSVGTVSAFRGGSVIERIRQDCNGW